MHELPIAKNVLNASIRYAKERGASRIVRIELNIGELRDFVPHLLQSYWKFIVRDTMAEGSEIIMHPVAPSLMCRKCKLVFDVTRTNFVLAACPECGGTDTVIFTGKELDFEKIVIE